MMTFKEIKQTFCIFLFGSVGAPIIYLVTGIICPRGFHFFLKYDFASLIIPFIVVWAGSFVFTAIIGGIFWKPLHKHKKDGVFIYTLIAILASSVLSLFTSHSISLLGIGMSAANAVMIRFFEISGKRAVV